MSRSETAIKVAYLALVWIAVLPNSASAQTWTCMVPAGSGCTIDVSRTATVNPFALRLENPTGVPVASHRIRFEPRDAPVELTTPRGDSTHTGRTNEQGIVAGYVKGPLSAPVSVTFQAEFPTGWKEQKLTLRPATQHVLEPAGSQPYYWYAGSQVPDGAAVQVKGVESEACRELVVRFEPVTPSSVSADSVFGEPAPQSDRICRFKTQWRLADQVGYQQLQATLGSARSVQLQAVARRKSSLRVSLAAAIVKNPSTLTSETVGTFHVSRVDPSGATIEYDSLVKVRSVTESKWALEAMPLILLDSPVHPRFTGLRLAIGAAPNNITRDFFVGFSLLQPFYKINIEDVGVDLQAGLIVNRDQRLREPRACEDAVEAAVDLKEPCATTESLRISGGAVTLSVDAQSLIGALGKMIGITP